MKALPKYRPSAKYPVEVYVACLRDAAPPEEPIDTPQRCADYFRTNVESSPEYRHDQEQFVVIFLNTRRRAVGHTIVTRGTANEVHIAPRETFRAAIVSNAHAVLLTHNHPSGDQTPSEADIRVTRELIRAGQTVKIEVLDHLIVGAGKHVSLRELGYFHA